MFSFWMLCGCQDWVRSSVTLWQCQEEILIQMASLYCHGFLYSVTMTLVHLVDLLAFKHDVTSLPPSLLPTLPPPHLHLHLLLLSLFGQGVLSG